MDTNGNGKNIWNETCKVREVMTIAFGADHAAYLLRDAVVARAKSLGHDVLVFGATAPAPFDYPDAANPVATAILTGEADCGVLCCGTGIGITIRANRFRGIRAANCADTVMASLSRQHNDANILGLGARILSESLAIEIFEMFVATEASRELRHVARVEKIDAPT